MNSSHVKQGGGTESDTRFITWLASYPKSGNTWVRMFLDCYIAQRPIELNNFHYRYCRGDLQPAMYQAVSPWPLQKLASTVQGLLRPAALMQMIAHQPEGHLILKTHHGHYDLADTPLHPKALTRDALYIVRDPRDVAVSWSHHFGVSIDQSITMLLEKAQTITDDDTNLKSFVGSWASHVASWDPYATIIRYEDMLSRTEEVFCKALDIVGFAFEEKRFSFALEQSNFANLSQLEDREGFLEKRQDGETQFFRQGMAGGWRDVLTEKQVKRIEAGCGSAMQKMDYKLTTEVSSGEAAEAASV